LDKCEVCGEKIEYLGMEKIPLDVDGNEITPGSYPARGSRANEKYREEATYGCRNGCTKMNSKEYFSERNVEGLA
jgi:hypothetical protein